MNIQKYRKMIMVHGILTMIYILFHFEDSEDYEECAILKDAILSFNFWNDWENVDRVTSSMLADVKNTMQQITGIELENIDKYYQAKAKALIEDIEHWKNA